MERCSFRFTKESYEAYLALKEWCRVNRVPMGRILNRTLIAMQDAMPPYAARHATIDIQYPKQTDIDDRIRYNKYKSNLTRVKV